jgi:hypothetical protein
LRPSPAEGLVSLSPGHAKMESVICYCKNCNLELGRFRNSWNAIGKTYHCPVYPMLTYDNGFEAVGDVFPSAAGSPAENRYGRLDAEDIIHTFTESMAVSCKI